APLGSFNLQSNGLTGAVRSELAGLTLVNLGAGNIEIAEKDSLVIGSGSRGALGGIYAASGTIDIALAGRESLLSLSSGVIQAAGAGKNISLTADDIDFSSGDNQVKGTGELALVARHAAQNYRVG